MNGSPRLLLLPLSVFAFFIVSGMLAGWNPWASGAMAALFAVMLAATMAMMSGARHQQGREDQRSTGA